MNQDIPDRRTARLILESMADGVFTLNDDGIITSWNPSMERISGYTAEEAVGRNCMLLNFSRCIARKCPSGVRECGIYTKGMVDAKECSIRHKDGHDVEVVKSARLVKDESGAVIGVVETVTDLTEIYTMRRRMEEANRRLGEIYQYHNIVGKSRVMQEVFSAIDAAAASDATVLISGESGTGKELVAGAIHYHSIRSEMPMVTVNCSALSESLLESELFGHVRGAFTGANRDRTGRFEEADGGTIFLDEIGEISPLIQLKLLRVLQEREVERVGESKTRKIDIRIIAATNKDLMPLVQQGSFRHDLYYRLKVFPIQAPPLRTRKEDIALLTEHFIAVQNKKTGKSIQNISPDAMRILMDYSWPGNVRELENAIEHAFVLCTGKQIALSDLPVEIRQAEFRLVCSDSDALPPTRDYPVRRRPTREKLVELLHECGWNKAEVARRIGLSRTSVWKYMKKWEIPLQPEN